MPIMIVVGSEEELKAGRGEPALTFTQAAARLGVTVLTLRKYIEKALITPFEERLSGALLFPESAVEQLRQSRLRDGY